MLPPESRRRRRGLSLCHGDDDGYSVVVGAIVFPAVIFFLMLVVQLALVWHGEHVAQAAAQDAVRSARQYGATDAHGQSDAQTWLAQVAGGLLPKAKVVVSRNAAATVVTAKVTSHVLSVVPLAVFSVSESAHGPVERYVPDVRGFANSEGSLGANPSGGGR